ncbi:MAG: type II toxin-antitoxin system RelB/DinJ family antitoxin [Atopobiaceae bacterium]|jgi:DNA-damage-inducible protein J|nr:type II toxin-antitoxin system RelB/DinJ family antitoxin [Atopobiaceae bacterium]MCI2174240.1 type II toxin-antitoxin system RelB/DinJ family antitoxin [Atopobiaceae bacterium]MCI2206881.1 type II toxin-antitoxin system RelB/DinJ family antitoxin [Atopobiaceae bacterium]
MDATTMSLRIDSNIKQDAAKVFSQLGMSFNTGVSIYLRTVVRENRIPFDLELGSNTDEERKTDR